MAGPLSSSVCAGAESSWRLRGGMQRLYVGGLGHTVTQKDLKDRFGKFGDVEDVELRTRRDTEGWHSLTSCYVGGYCRNELLGVELSLQLVSGSPTPLFYRYVPYFFCLSAGVPYKTFGYININISDANLKRCKEIQRGVST